MDSVTASTTPKTSPEPELEDAGADGAGDNESIRDGNQPAGDEASEADVASVSQAKPRARRSLASRMMAIAAGWILILLVGGGFALDRTLTNLVERNFDEQLEYMLTAMISSAEVDFGGEVYFNRTLGDQRFLEPNSGLYWQISGEGFEDYPSRSLWDRTLEVRGDHEDDAIHMHNSNQFADEPLRVAERSVYLPGSDTKWWFTVAASREELDFQITRIRSILIWSFAALAIGLMAMAALQNWFGLGPLRRVRAAIQALRSSGANRITEPLPLEVEPLVEEINGLLAHTEQQAEEARTHAGNLAHALKTPLTVLTNAATARADDLADTTIREARTMQRHVDHHLARARAVGRRAVGHARTSVDQSAKAVQRAVERLYPETRFDIDTKHAAMVAIERQDLDEILGNLIENAAKYGGGSVFVTIDIEPENEQCVIWIEDDGMGIPPEKRDDIFDRGARLDTGKPGTGLGLAIVRDVAEIYGGSVELEESEDLGGLLVVLSLPRASEEAG